MNEPFDLQKVKDHSMAPRRRRHQFPTEPTAVLDDLSIDDEIVRLQERLNELERLKQSMAAPPAATSDPGLSLFPWQRDALDAWSDRRQCGVVQAVTGAGKTRVGIAAIAEALESGVRAVVMVLTLVLQQQWVNSLRELLPVAHVSTRIGDESSWQVMVTTVQSAMHRAVLSRSQPGLLVADECHRYGAESFARALGPEYAWRLHRVARRLRLLGEHAAGADGRARGPTRATGEVRRGDRG